MADMFDPGYDMQQYLLNPIFIDLGTIADQTLLTHTGTAGAELAFKHVFTKSLDQYVEAIAKGLRQSDDNIRTLVLKYVFNASDVSSNLTILDKLTAALPEEEKFIMTIAEQLRQQGEHEAKLAVAKNMLTKNTDLHFVQEVTGLSEQDLLKLIKSHQT